MCGIVGFFCENVKEAEKILKQINKLLIHRGPDEDGYYIDKKIALANRRLSILDISNGKQPFYNEDKSIITVFNGEIYNYKELRNYLLKKNHILKTNCDTEIIPHLYEEYETEMFDLLDGQFAIAIYDKRKDILILARDPFGIRPLYYYQNGQDFSFASEIKGLFTFNNQKNISEKGLVEYFYLGYNFTENTIFKDIKKLSPASYMVIRNGKIIKKDIYWHLKIENKKQYNLEKIDFLLKNSVKKRLQADVKVGLLLSGGIDSSLLAYYLKELNANVETYTLGFYEKGFDESKYAQYISRYLGLKNHIYMIDENILKDNLSIITELDEPFADSAFLNVYLITKFIKDGVKVLLSGEGGDELFAGYYTHEATLLNEKLKPILPIAKEISTALLKLIPYNDRKIGWEFKLKKFLEHIEKNSLLAHLHWKIMYKLAEIKNIFPNIQIYDLFENFDLTYKNMGEMINKMLYYDVKTYLHGDLLVKMDRAAMLNSIEGRVPYLDKELFEYLFSIDGANKLSLFKKKIILKKIAKKKLPKFILNKPKRGFSLPLSFWMRTYLYDEIFNTIEKIEPANIEMNKTILKKQLLFHYKKKNDFSRPLWTTYLFLKEVEKERL